MEEKTIMTSNDNSITLTNKRLIQRTSEHNVEIKLEDIISHHVVKKKTTWYKVSTIIFAIATFLIYLGAESQYNEAIMIGFWVFMFFTLISVLFLFTTFNKFLNIRGKYNEIEFPLQQINEESLNDFLNKLYALKDQKL